MCIENGEMELQGRRWQEGTGEALDGSRSPRALNAVLFGETSHHPGDLGCLSTLPPFPLNYCRLLRGPFQHLLFLLSPPQLPRSKAPDSVSDSVPVWKKRTK